MIKTTIEPSEKECMSYYPRLMEFVPRPGLIVLFTSEHTGTVVAVPKEGAYHKVGDHSTIFDPCTKPDRWTDFNQKLILENRYK